MLKKGCEELITARQQDILRLIIQTFTTTGQPVGSKFLMEAGIKASSATIRNDMSALEDLGLLVKTHSSSGRVPSLAGYRYYVDHLVSPSEVPMAETKMIQQAFLQPFKEIDDIVEASATILSQLTSYTAFSLGPEVNERKLTGFRIIPLNPQQIVALIVTDHGNVESEIFTIPRNVTSSDLEKMVNLINERLVGQPLLTVYQKLRTEIPLILQRYFQTPQGISNLFDEIFSDAFDDRIFVGGKMNLLDHSLAEDVSRFRSLYSLIENKEALAAILDKQTIQDKPIAIAIGDEIGNQVLNDMSMITASYEVKGHGKGTISLLGPTNMPYSKVIGLMDVFRQEMERRLADYYRPLEGPTKHQD